jgi:uncharacterized protein (DUF58 family)
MLHDGCRNHTADLEPTSMNMHHPSMPLNSESPTRALAEAEISLQRPSLIIFLGILVVVALITTSPIAYWLLYALGSVVAASYFWIRHTAPRLHLRRRLRTPQLSVNDDVEEQFELINDSYLPVLLVEIEDHSDLPRYQASVIESLGTHQTKRWRCRGTAVRRGFFRLGPTDIHVGDPFGIFLSTRRINDYSNIVVYPPVSVMPDVTIPTGMMVGTSQSSIRTQQITSDVRGIRDFQTGDPLKRIHWPSTARRGQLLVKEFDLEPTASLWIALDLEASVQAGEGEASTEEYGVKIVSSIAHQFIRDNRSVGFTAFSRGTRHFIKPQKGLKQLWRILEALAVVKASSTVPFDQFLSAALPGFDRGTSLVAISPSPSPRWATILTEFAHQSIHPLAIAIDASSFGEHPSNIGLQAQAAASGIHFVSITKGMDFETLRTDGYAREEFERSYYRPGATTRK